MQAVVATQMPVLPRTRTPCAPARVMRVGPVAQPRKPIQKRRLIGEEQEQQKRAVRARPQPVATPQLAPVRSLPEKFNLSSLSTIVISLDRRQDRMDGCALRLDTYCAGLRYERFSATDGRATAIPEEEVTRSWNTARNVIYQKMRAVRKGWDDLDSYQVRTLDLSPGERGCASSHIRAWRRCIEQSGGEERPLLVLEDDAAPTPEFTATLCRAMAALPSDAGLLYLGYSQAADWRREVSPDLVEAEYVWTTVAYVVWPAAARKLLARLPVNEPVDNWMAGLCAGNEVKAYCVRPKIVRQADAWNVNSDVAHSDEHYWGPCSDIQHSDEFYWGATDAKKDDARPLAGSCFWDVDSGDSEDSGSDA